MFQQRAPFGVAALCEHGFDQRIERIDVAIALRQGGKARISGERSAARDRKELAPVCVRIGHHGDMAIARFERLARVGGDAVVAGRAERRHKAAATQVLDHHEGDQTLEHRHFNRLARASALARVERHRNRLRHPHGGDLVGDDALDIARRPIRAALKPGHAAGRLDRVIHTGPPGVGAGLGVGVAAAIDQPRMARLQRCVVEAQARQPLRAHVRYKHIGAFDQGEQGGAVLFELGIEHDAALVAIEIEKGVAHAGVALRMGMAEHVAALRRFNLDDIGPHVGQHLRGPRPHADRGHVDHAHARQCARRRCGIWFSLRRLSRCRVHCCLHCFCRSGARMSFNPL